MNPCDCCGRPLGFSAIAEGRTAHLECLPSVRRVLARFRGAADRGDLIGASLDEIRGVVGRLVIEEDR